MNKPARMAAAGGRSQATSIRNVPSASEPGRMRSTRRANTVIRPACEADLPQVIAIDEQITRLAKPEYWESMLRNSRRAQHKQYFLVAATEGAEPRIVGFILGEVRAWEFGSAPCGWVFGLSVHPHVRLQGIGQALLDALVKKFRAAGVTKMRTMVGRDNQLHLLFFRAAGMMAGPYVELEKELG